nr:Chain C, Epstein-Barr nuclear antigen 3 [human gammaherpesvirus 4]
FLRGRAYVL